MNFWTEQREEQLRNLWAEGHSAAFIRQEMRATSRSAILGKVHRLGLPMREVKTRHAEPKPRATKPARIVSNNNGYVPRADSKPPLPVKLTDVEQTNEFPIVYGHAQAVINLHSEQGAERCGFPMGEGERFHYCTNRKANGKHYCPGHHAACWTKPKRVAA